MTDIEKSEFLTNWLVSKTTTLQIVGPLESFNVISTAQDMNLRNIDPIDIKVVKNALYKQFQKLHPVDQKILHTYDLFSEETLTFLDSYRRHRITKNSNIEPLSKERELTDTLKQIYTSGKKLKDLIFILDEQGIFKLTEDEKSLLQKFAQTRNRIFEHNQRPSDKDKKLNESLEGIIIKPSMFDAIGTNCSFSYEIIKGSEVQRGIVNYIQDYLDVENLLIRILGINN